MMLLLGLVRRVVLRLLLLLLVVALGSALWERRCAGALSGTLPRPTAMKPTSARVRCLLVESPALLPLALPLSLPLRRSRPLALVLLRALLLSRPRRLSSPPTGDRTRCGAGPGSI